MKIDPVTYEVDMSAGTHPLYVWEAPVRMWHWAMMVCMFVMIVTGFLIGAPLVSNLGDTWATYDFAYIRFAHFAAGIIYTVLFIYRLYWAVVGNKYSRQIFIPPLWSWKWWKGVFGQVAYYLFMKKTSAEYAGHNPLAQLAMFGFFVLGSILLIITGLALYAQAWGADTSWMAWFGWVFTLFGDAQAVRTVHHALMYVLIIFTIAHMYMSFREDIMGGCTTLSSMTTGLRMFKHAGGDEH